MVLHGRCFLLHVSHTNCLPVYHPAFEGLVVRKRMNRHLLNPSWHTPLYAKRKTFHFGFRIRKASSALTIQALVGRRQRVKIRHTSYGPVFKLSFMSWGMTHSSRFQTKVGDTSKFVLAASVRCLNADNQSKLLLSRNSSFQ